MTTKNINSLKAHQLIEENKNNPNFIIIDVRTPDEHNEFHIKNSNLINIYNPTFIQKIQQLDKNKTYLIYCRTGSRSSHAAQFMTQSGFKNIYNLENGILDWKSRNLELN